MERTALNIIGRMSGIATQTRTFVALAKAENPRCRVAVHAKPVRACGRWIKKPWLLVAAILTGGGLSDGVLIKDNHLVLVPIHEAIRRAKAASMYRKIEVEVETADDALAAARAGADILLLDNMTTDSVRYTLHELEQAGIRDKVTIELSGGITGETIREYAQDRG